MVRTHPPLALAVSAVLFAGQACTHLPPGALSPMRVVPNEGGVHVLDEYVAVRVHALELKSRRFAAALDTVRKGLIPIFIGTPQQLVTQAPWAGRILVDTHLAQTVSRIDTLTGSVLAIAIQIDLERIAHYRWRWVPPISAWLSQRERNARFDSLIEDILIHELWGHLIPVASTGNIRSSCADPLPGQAELESCVMQRENELRRELGLRPRWTYAVAYAW